MNPEFARSGDLQTIQGEIRSTNRCCARMVPIELLGYPKALERLAALAEEIGDECPKRPEDSNARRQTWRCRCSAWRRSYVP